MDTIHLQNDMSLEQYQMEIEIGIRKDIQDDFYFELSKEDLEDIEISNNEIEEGVYFSHQDVINETRKYRKAKRRNNFITSSRTEDRNITTNRFKNGTRYERSNP